jgi:hypothetical protein
MKLYQDIADATIEFSKSSGRELKGFDLKDI